MKYQEIFRAKTSYLHISSCVEKYHSKRNLVSPRGYVISPISLHGVGRNIWRTNALKSEKPNKKISKLYNLNLKT